HLAIGPHDTAPWTPRSEIDLQRWKLKKRTEAARRYGEESSKGFFQAPGIGGIVEPEHRAHDDVEGDRSHARMNRECLADGEARNRLARDRAHHAAIRLHPLALKRWQDEASIVQ